MTKIGYTLLGEQAHPRQLVLDGLRAERAGFDFVAISDHFLPWLESQGHSPYTWSVLGALTEVTEHIPLMTFVTCPTIRYHPVVVAQKAATVSLLSDGRFSLGLGAGENLNEHVVGHPWPPVDTRHEMLYEAIEIIRALWRGDYVTYHGKHFTAEDAKLYDTPDSPPPIGIAASGPQSGRLAGKRADALIAVSPDSQLVRLFEQSGGDGRPRYGQLPICYDTDETKARARARELWRFAAAGWKVMAELPGPVNFDAYSQHVSEDDIAKLVSCGPSVSRHVRAVADFVDAGFDHVALVGVGGEQQTDFMAYCQHELLPALRGQLPAVADG